MRIDQARRLKELEQENARLSFLSILIKILDNENHPFYHYLAIWGLFFLQNLGVDL